MPGRLGQHVHGAHKDSSGHSGRQERFCLPVRGESQPGETSGLQCTHELMLGSVESSGIFPRVPHAAAKVGVICPCCSSKLACNSLYSQSRKKWYVWGKLDTWNGQKGTFLCTKYKGSLELLLQVYKLIFSVATVSCDKSFSSGCLMKDWGSWNLNRYSA